MSAAPTEWRFCPPAVHTLKVLNFGSGEISEKDFFILWFCKSISLLLLHIMEESYFNKEKTQTILVVCTFIKQYKINNPAVLLKVKEKFYEIVN